MNNIQQSSNGQWVSAEPLPYFEQIDFEVYKKAGGWIWEAYYKDKFLKRGFAKTKIGLKIVTFVYGIYYGKKYLNG